MIIACKVTVCPYFAINESFCARPQMIGINEHGVCEVWERIVKQKFGDKSCIKNSIIIEEANFKTIEEQGKEAAGSSAK